MEIDNGTDESCTKKDRVIKIIEAFTYIITALTMREKYDECLIKIKRTPTVLTSWEFNTVAKKLKDL